MRDFEAAISGAAQLSKKNGKILKFGSYARDAKRSHGGTGRLIRRAGRLRDVTKYLGQPGFINVAAWRGKTGDRQF
jgi:hypothetical protein